MSYGPLQFQYVPTSLFAGGLGSLKDRPMLKPMVKYVANLHGNEESDPKCRVFHVKIYLLFRRFISLLKK